MSKRDFEKILLEAVDEGLSSLGNSSKQAIYFHLDKSFNIKKEEIPAKIEAFIAAVENIFGMGAGFLEISIMKQLREKTGQNVEWQMSNNLTFNEYLLLIERAFLQRNDSRKTTGRTVECEEIIVET